MFEDRLGEQLRKDLDGPSLSAPHPTQARYRLNALVPRHRVGGMLRVGSAFVAGAIVAAALLSAGTGSTNPRVWTVRVASALSELTGPATPPQPAPTPSGGEGSRGGDSRGESPVVVPDDHSAVPSGGSHSARGLSPSDRSGDGSRTPTPTASPDDHGSGGSGGATPGPRGDGSPDSMPTPTPTSEPEH